MANLITSCPSCHGRMAINRLQCPQCHLALEGEFTLPALFGLAPAQLDFVEVFVKNRGIIREVERELGVSYPTVRARLDEVIRGLGFAPAENGTDTQAATRRTILADLQAGKISPERALELLAAGKTTGEKNGEDAK